MVICILVMFENWFKTCGLRSKSDGVFVSLHNVQNVTIVQHDHEQSSEDKQKREKKN